MSSDRANITAKCSRFKNVRNLTLYCEGSEQPITFESREKLSEFMKDKCNEIENNCDFSKRSRCCMETISVSGHHHCSAYAIKCHRATCKFYKSKHDAAVAELKVKERLLKLPEEERRYYELKYGRK